MIAAFMGSHEPMKTVRLAYPRGDLNVNYMHSTCVVGVLFIHLAPRLHSLGPFYTLQL